jgi:hypothetical protein
VAAAGEFVLLFCRTVAYCNDGLLMAEVHDIGDNGHVLFTKHHNPYYHISKFSIMT